MNERLQHIIEAAEEDGHVLEIISEVKSGKEADIYRVVFNGEMLAMKLYKNPEERSFQNSSQYLSGKHYHRSSHRRAVAKGNAFGKKLKHGNWIAREFLMLKKLHDAGASIPKPVIQIKDAILMEFIGDQDTAGGRLIDTEISTEVAKKMFPLILENIKLFWKHGIVHGDLSPYNVLCWNDRPVIIDFPQSIDIRNYPNPWEVLERDLTNIIHYFKKYFEIDEEKIKEEFQRLCN